MAPKRKLEEGGPSGEKNAKDDGSDRLWHLPELVVDGIAKFLGPADLLYFSSSGKSWRDGALIKTADKSPLSQF
ncbi:hypothetical protein AXF42_Ash000138 [Apostasia shenzhenica]|uniref:F-box protein n=1 Tax=Apostasia shenzhenica TaxID=1088818 RepID=A0A2I0AFK8_9ASPA|nr:hypothetical protein AXF42_Ash000138 [Apostasia shenzhenica]